MTLPVREPPPEARTAKAALDHGKKILRFVLFLPR